MEMDPFFVVPEETVGAPVASDDSHKYNAPNVAAAARTTIPEIPKAVIDTPANKAFSLDEANEEIALLLQNSKVSQKEVSALQGMMRDHVALLDKVSKLKSLLGRSAKAQREAKMELEGTQKKLETALRENESLSAKVERLANRPTHMDLLADFETNFDRALLSVGQTGGENTAAPSIIIPQAIHNDGVVDSMLMEELAESQTRIERLENINSALIQRSTQLENQTKLLQQEKDNSQQMLARMTLELRMAQMEADHATRAVQDKLASLAEMQLEIDLVTKASMDANVRASKGEEAAKSVQTDREQVQILQAQVQALQEWALASAEAKRLFQDRVRYLEHKLQLIEGASLPKGPAGERMLFTKASSLVIGAGDDGFAIVDLASFGQGIMSTERVIVRWMFDLTPETASIDFSILKGKTDTPTKQLKADFLVKDRVVTGGAGGEQEAAFVVQNACTFLWSNKKSWVRPKTVKYSVSVMAVKD